MVAPALAAGEKSPNSTGQGAGEMPGGTASTIAQEQSHLFALGQNPLQKPSNLGFC